MNTDESNERELLRLCGLMVDGGLNEADMERLSELLTSNASSRQFYRGYMDAHTRLLVSRFFLRQNDTRVAEFRKLGSKDKRDQSDEKIQAR